MKIRNVFSFISFSINKRKKRYKIYDDNNHLLINFILSFLLLLIKEKEIESAITTCWLIEKTRNCGANNRRFIRIEKDFTFYYPKISKVIRILITDNPQQ